MPYWSIDVISAEREVVGVSMRNEEMLCCFGLIYIGIAYEYVPLVDIFLLDSYLHFPHHLVENPKLFVV